MPRSPRSPAARAARRGRAAWSGLDFEEDEALALRHCIRVAKKAVVVADSTKFERVAKASVAPLGAVHVLVSDERLSGDWRIRLEANGVEVVTAAVR